MAYASSNYADASFTLNNGVQMPAIGFGTLGLNNENTLKSTIDKALATGYRLFDTASIYGNEKQIGAVLEELLQKHHLTREDIFITTKLSPACCDPKHVNKSFNRSLENLKLDYVDMYMINFPAPTLFPNKQTLPNFELRIGIWKCIIKLYEESKIRAIGVSNFTIQHLIELIDNTSMRPMVNQLEWHPYFHQPSMLQFCNEYDIRLQAFSSFGGLSRGDTFLVNEPIVKGVATRHEVTANQVLLAWSLQRGISVIPKSKKEEHMAENRNIAFRLSDRDMTALDSLGVRNINYKRDPADVI